MTGLLLAAAVLFLMSSTKETRAAGAEAAKPYGYWCGGFMLLFWAAVVFL